MATPEDFFPEIEIGQTIGMVDEQTIPCLVGAGGVTKGYNVKFSDIDTFPQVVTAAGAAKAHGVALKTGVEDDTVDVLVYGITKQYAGGAIVAGVPVKSDAAHKPVTGGVFADAYGVSFQKAGEADDEILIFVGAR
ncbi:MAG: hypothetical protein NWE89_12080 [Candidatus Bathyarchaeota archaeon]|nr:hypothetical protein [Candidatus Bathyarchaeota archaeon]